MSKKICFLYTDTNKIDPESTLAEDDIPSTKNLYHFDRLIAIHYSIGTFDNKYNEIKRVNTIIKPDTIAFNNGAIDIHKITYNEANEKGIVNSIAIQQLKDDLKDVDCIISYNLSYHIKSIQVECFRTAISIDFSKYELIDIIEQYKSTTQNSHKFVDIMKKLKLKKSKYLDDLIQVFFKLI
jgi:hypothetical protein